MVVVALLAGGVVSLYLWQLVPLKGVGGNHLDTVPLVVAGSWWANSVAIPVRNRRVSFALNLGPLPILFAIADLAPLWGLVAVVVGVLAGKVQKRKPLDRALVTCLSGALAMCGAIWVFHHTLGHLSPASPQGWLVDLLATAVMVFGDLVLLLAAVAACTWRWRAPPLGTAVLHSALIVGLCSVGGIVAIAVAKAGTWDLVLFGAVFVAADLGWRRAARAAQRHASNERLYRFTQRLALAEGGAEDLVTAVLEGARSLLSTSRAALVAPLAPPLDDLVLRCSLGGDAPVEVEHGVRRSQLASLVAARGALVVARGTRLAELLDSAHPGFREAVVAPLAPGNPQTGYLLIADREFTHEGFRASDIDLLQTMAMNTALALAKGDLIDRLRNEAAVREYEALHDALTGLPNRAMLVQRLDEALRAAGPSHQVGVVLVDLDGFKQLNDLLGHHNGDAVLSEVAKRLGPLADAATMVARVGGDEFAVVVDGATEAQDFAGRAHDVLAAMAAPMQVSGLELIIRASVGVAGTPSPSTEAHALVHEAELATYRAKSQGGGVRSYEPEDGLSSPRRLTMASELRKAIEHGELDLHYQIVFDVRTGLALGCEALARWSHEQLGVVPPEQFIRVAERAGLIDPLTWWAIERSLEQVKLWRQSVPDLSVSVNLSALSLLRGGMARRVGQALDRVGLDPSALRLELTESSMMADMGKKALGEIRALGVALSVDDFGTGYSSLSRLRGLPFDEVKIDRSFVSEMCRVSADEAVVRSVIELARGLGKLAIAEGVEDRATLERLALLGCHGAQGYYLAPPVPPDECGVLLRARATGQAR